mmetsp:Transcript_23612/g.56220  ORF Transcript_23612/g.56220 Transcript_23612/m.56220 type:complete len:123 (+) Transcript_23612:391-759(+)
MLRREQDLRVAPATLDKLRRGANYATLMEKIQRQVAREFGVPPDQEMVAVRFIRSAETLFPGDQLVRDSVLWMKYNRCRQGSLGSGMAAPDVPLLNLDGSKTRLSSLWSPNKPLVIVSGSFT